MSRERSARSYTLVSFPAAHHTEGNCAAEGGLSAAPTPAPSPRIPPAPSAIAPVSAFLIFNDVLVSSVVDQMIDVFDSHTMRCCLQTYLGLGT